LLAALVTAASAWIAYQRVRVALATEFEARLERLAGTTASQIDPDLVHDVQDKADESPGYLTVQVQLVTLRSATGIEDASLIDSARTVLVDARAPEESERLTAG